MTHEKKVAGPPEFETSEDRFEHDMEELEAPPWRKNKTTVIIALVIFVIVGAGLTYLFMTEKKQVKSVVPIVMQIDVLEPRPGKLGNTPTKFRWETVSSTKYYSFVLSAKGSTTILIQRASNLPSVTLTQEELSRISKGVSYVWTVQAFSDIGKVLGRCESAFDL